MKNKLLTLVFVPMLLASCDQENDLDNLNIHTQIQKSSTAEGKSTSHILGLTNYTLKVNDPEDDILYLNEGENKFLKEYQMNVTFKGLKTAAVLRESIVSGPELRLLRWKCWELLPDLLF